MAFTSHLLTESVHMLCLILFFCVFILLKADYASSSVPHLLKVNYALTDLVPQIHEITHIYV